MDEYGYLCPVCNKVRPVGTCPTCPDVLLLKVKRTLNPRTGYRYWRRLS